MDCNEAIRLEPEANDAYACRAWLYLEKGDLEKALADCNELIGRDAEDAESLYRRGFGYAAQKKWPQCDCGLHGGDSARRRICRCLFSSCRGLRTNGSAGQSESRSRPGGKNQRGMRRVALFANQIHHLLTPTEEIDECLLLTRLAAVRCGIGVFFCWEAC